MTAIERTVRRAKQILVEEGAAWGTAVDGSMLRAAARSTRYTLTAPDPQKWRRHEAAIEAHRPLWEPAAARAEALLRR